MTSEKIKFIQQQTQIATPAIQAVIKLNDEGSTVAFIARYRKDATGNLDELGILDIIKYHQLFDELEKRKAFIIESITSQGKLTPELEQKIKDCWDKEVLEDLYLPYKQRKKTRADIAREKGLEPLAKVILAQRESDIEYAAQRYVNSKVADIDEAIAGAMDIVAQWIADDAETRTMLRQRFEQHAFIETKVAKGKEKSADGSSEKYKDYFKYSEKAATAPSHRIMAIMRAVDEGVLKLSIAPDEDRTLEALDRKWIRRDSASEKYMLDITKDAYKRLLLPSLENELGQKLFEKAEEQAIKVFADNLQQLLLSSPLGNKRILAIDPGIRTGCKTVCLNETGNLQHHTVLYFNSSHDKEQSNAAIRQLVTQYKIEAVAVGNGTAGRETADAVKQLKLDLPVFLVNEDGASVYSVSEVARKEFPNHDVTVKGAVSIGRRLMDPLAELVKIDAKSIGVGQYQHDVNQNKLKQALEETVAICVNRVGVNLNTAGEELLKHVSGLGPVLARNIIEYRNSKGGFTAREELKKVARLGDKAYEQCAGFLRVPDSANPLDRSGVHPEQYNIVKLMVKEAGVKLEQLVGHPAEVSKLTNSSLKTQVGELAFKDLLKELEKPGLDPRESLSEDVFEDTIRKIEDIHEGMVIKGVVVNITNFGAFIDIGIKQSGMLHISEMANHFIKSPSEIVKLNQQLTLKVKEIDLSRNRIALTLKF
ncbi:MAG: Tex-like N-terminal domain-containing protein [Bacteroidota bacterium]